MKHYEKPLAHNLGEANEARKGEFNKAEPHIAAFCLGSLCLSEHAGGSS